MRKLLSCALVLLVTQGTFAQMDDKFYFPSKKWEPVMDSLKHREINFFFDKDTVNTVLIPAEAKKTKATIIYFHGAGGNVTRYVPLIRPLIKDGYQVFMVDFRGYGKSSGKPTHVGIAKDAQKIFDSVLQLPEIRKTKIVVFGASMGTQIATKLTADNQAKIAALILDGAIASFTDIAADSSPEAQREMIRRMLPSPYSAKESIKQLTTMPVLFIHSKEDKDVPFAHGEMVFQNATTKKEMWVYTGDHLMAGKLFPAELVARVNKLLK